MDQGRDVDRRGARGALVLLVVVLAGACGFELGDPPKLPRPAVIEVRNRLAGPVRVAQPDGDPLPDDPDDAVLVIPAGEVDGYRPWAADAGCLTAAIVVTDVAGAVRLTVPEGICYSSGLSYVVED